MKIGAIILGAGQSQRMGQPKLLLPWGRELVITHIIHVLQAAGIDKIVLVTGRSHELLVNTLHAGTVQLVFNPDFANGNMVDSLKTGLRSLQQIGSDSALLALGDQPQILTDTVELVLQAGREHPEQLILPSYQMKRGHPWVVPAGLWPQIFALKPDQTMRDFVRSLESRIHYVRVDTPSIFADLDTPEDYAREKPQMN